MYEPQQSFDVETMQNRPDGSGWIFALAKRWLFTECIVKNGRHLRDAIH